MRHVAGLFASVHLGTLVMEPLGVFTPVRCVEPGKKAAVCVHLFQNLPRSSLTLGCTGEHGDGLPFPQSSVLPAYVAPKPSCTPHVPGPFAWNPCGA